MNSFGISALVILCLPWVGFYLLIGVILFAVCWLYAKSQGHELEADRKFAFRVIVGWLFYAIFIAVTIWRNR
jgi:hypothetical protein